MSQLNRFWHLVLAAPFLLCPITLHAQVNTSAIAGIVTDSTGSVVPGAAVSVTQSSTGLVRKVTTSNNGEYVVAQLGPGSYEVKVEATGFQQGIARDVNLAIAQRERVDFALKVGAVSEQVEVTARAAIAETETASLGQLIERRVIQYLPLNGLPPAATYGVGTRRSGSPLSNLSRSAVPHSVLHLLALRSRTPLLQHRVP